MTSWSQSGSVVSFVNSGTNNFTAGDWVNARFLTGWAPGLPTGMILGTGHTLFQVLTTGLSATTFQFNVGSLTEGTCSSSCGLVESAMSNGPFITTNRLSFPATAIQNTYVYIPSDVTIEGAATYYANLFHAISPGQNAGRPGYLILNDHGNDDQLCNSPSGIVQPGYQSFMSQAHADGWIVVVGTGLTHTFNQLVGCSTAYNYWNANRQWLFQQGKTVSTLLTGQYWDILVDTSSPTSDGSNTNFLTSTTAPAGAQQVFASATAAAIADGAGVPVVYRPWSWGNLQGQISGGEGYVFQPSVDSAWAFQFQNAAGNVIVARVDTSEQLFLANDLYVASLDTSSGNECVQTDTNGHLTKTGAVCRCYLSGSFSHHTGSYRIRNL